MEGELLPLPPEDSASSTAYEGDISMVDSQGSVELSEALPSESETDADILTTPTKSPTTTPPTSQLKFTPLSHSLRSPSSIQTSRKRTLTDHRQQAELIQAQSRIFQLETEVLSLQCAAKRARIEEEGKTHEEAKSSGQAERLHKVRMTPASSTAYATLCSVRFVPCGFRHVVQHNYVYVLTPVPHYYL